MFGTFLHYYTLNLYNISTRRLYSRDAKRKQDSGNVIAWLKLAGEKIRRDQVGSVHTFLSVRANKVIKWKIGLRGPDKSSQRKNSCTSPRNVWKIFTLLYTQLI